MKFYCDRDQLLEAVNNASKATSSSSSIGILSGIKLIANDNLKLKATNLEISIECEIEANIIEPGETVIDARMLFDIVRKSFSGVINFEINEKNEAFIYTKSNKYNILCLDGTDYPEVEKIEGERRIEINSSDFKQVVRDTVFAVATDESRPILTGVKFEITKNEMKLVAIDGFRLAIRRQIIKNESENFEFVIKGRILNEVLKVLKDDDTPFYINLKGNSVMFEFDNCKIISSLMNGEYISYEHFIPKKSTAEIRVDRRLLTQTVERAAIIINYDDNRLPVILKIDANIMCVECYSKMGNFNEEIDIVHKGESLEIGLGVKFLTETLKAVEEDEIIMELTDEKSPCVITPTEGDRFLYLILPRQIKR